MYISSAACRLCRRIEKQQQRQQKQQEDLVQTQKQQYINFMIEMRQQQSGPDPIKPSQAHVTCAHGECPLPLSWTNGDADDYHQQQVKEQATYGTEAHLPKSQKPCDAMTPAVQTPSAFNAGLHAR